MTQPTARNGAPLAGGNFHGFTATGIVTGCDAKNGRFIVKLMSGESISVLVSATTWYEVLRNVGEDPQDRVADPSDAAVQAAIGPRPEGGKDPKGASFWDACRQLLKYIEVERMVCVQGVQSVFGNLADYEARHVVLMHSRAGLFGWEVNHWWPHQINTLVEQWLDVLFENRREITENDFAQFYRTNLDLLGRATSNVAQECATLSRFLYGLSSSYLLTGNPRALSAARAAAAYLINAYSDLRRGGIYCLWKFGRVQDGVSTKQVFASKNGDDLGTYALYEQIYALSGLTQFYRITQDVWVLSYITRTIETFQGLFLDDASRHPAGDPCYTGKGGYFSHIDYVTLRPDSPALDATGNRMKKNWNSVGDHIPAYMVNLLIALDPLPKANCATGLEATRDLGREILENCVRDILDHFHPAGEKGDSPYVQERFFADWTPDYTWGWQQDRAIVGHNLKISWNLTRCGHYFQTLATELAKLDAAQSEKYQELTERCYDFAKALGKSMIHHGVDLVRGGIFDAVERHPKNGMPIQFAWDSTKDFWQQEQAILAYYIMHGIEPRPDEKVPSDPSFLELARTCSAFWNMFFIDQDNRKTFFRTNESGMPVISGSYGIQAGHAIAGYHAFELCYLAHIYVRAYVTGPLDPEEVFTLTFCPSRVCAIDSINVLPDFLPPGTVEVAAIRVDGFTQPSPPLSGFQLDISSYRKDAIIEVEFHCKAGMASVRAEKAAPQSMDRTGGVEPFGGTEESVATAAHPAAGIHVQRESTLKRFEKKFRRSRIEFGHAPSESSKAQDRASGLPRRTI